MVLSSLLPEKKSPVRGIPVIPGGTLWGGHLHLLQEPNFEVALKKWTVEHADENGRCTFWMGPTTPSLSVRHPDDVQVLLKGTAHRNTFGLMNNHFQQMFGTNNVGMLNGKAWKQQRAKITKALHSSQVVASHEQAFRDATQRLVETIKTHVAQTNNDNANSEWQCDDILLLMKSLTMDCFGQAAFHSNFGSCQHLVVGGDENSSDKIITRTEGSQIGPAFDRLTKEMMRRVTKDIMNPMSHNYSLPTTTNKNYANDKEMVLSFLQKLIKERQALIKDSKESTTEDTTSNQPPMDLLSGFLEHFGTTDDENDDDVNEEELVLIIAQSIMGLVFAGYETSSVTICYALYLLSQHPEVFTKCLEEIQNNNNNNNNNKSTGPSTKKNVYLEAVVKETLRLYPPAISTNRNSDRELELPARNGADKIVVPTGTYLYVPIWTIQRDEENYENPLEFQPERWVELVEGQKCEWKVKTDISDKARNAWIPFSVGARACPGQHFAMQEATTILSVLLPQLSFTPSQDYVLTPHRDGFIQVPKGGLPMKIAPRK